MAVDTRLRPHWRQWQSLAELGDAARSSQLDFEPWLELAAVVDEEPKLKPPRAPRSRRLRLLKGGLGLVVLLALSGAAVLLGPPWIWRGVEATARGLVQQLPAPVRSVLTNDEGPSLSLPGVLSSGVPLPVARVRFTTGRPARPAFVTAGRSGVTEPGTGTAPAAVTGDAVVPTTQVPEMPGPPDTSAATPQSSSAPGLPREAPPASPPTLPSATSSAQRTPATPAPSPAATQGQGQGRQAATPAPPPSQVPPLTPIAGTVPPATQPSSSPAASKGKHKKK